MQGALFGARSLASGLGPIIFAALFALFSRSDTGLPYFPGTCMHEALCFFVLHKHRWLHLLLLKTFQ